MSSRQLSKINEKHHSFLILYKIDLIDISIEHERYAENVINLYLRQTHTIGAVNTVYVRCMGKLEMRLTRNNLDCHEFQVEFQYIYELQNCIRLTKLPNKLNCRDAKGVRFAYLKF